MKKVSVLGHKGMLGHQVKKVLEKDFDVITFDRNKLDAENTTTEELNELLKDADWVINCIGLIKQKMDNTEECKTKAKVVNTLFPAALSRTGKNIIQIATDCIFSGEEGMYDEKSPFSAKDTYGLTKYMGEIRDETNFANLRCSIVGPEPNSSYSLLGWFLSQNGTVNGYTNHWWNGITSLAFAKICRGIIKNGSLPCSLQHIIPSGKVVSKYELLEMFSEVYGKNKVKKVECPTTVDRTLSTLDQEKNRMLWVQAGYKNIPTIKDLIIELYEEER